MVAEKVFDILKRVRAAEGRKVFDTQLLKNTSLVRAMPTPDGDLLVFGLQVNNELCNLYGCLHGGAISTIVNCVTTIHAWARDPAGRLPISTDLSLSFYITVLPTQYLEITTAVTSINERFAYTTASLVVGNLVVGRGTQTLFFLDKTLSDALLI